MKKTLLSLLTSLAVVGCGSDYDFKTKPETKAMSNQDVAVLACMAFGELDFKQLQELSFESYKRSLQKYIDDKKSTEKWEKAAENINCQVVESKESPKHKTEAFVFKGFNDVTVYDKDDYKVAAISKR